ncbi:MAG TPA: hypothetical protein VFK36_00020 [Gemmatimonadales bacterium]|nr:hypothetical protein [Gemmatimonadales bacterium]
MRLLILIEGGQLRSGPDAGSDRAMPWATGVPAGTNYQIFIR